MSFQIHSLAKADFEYLFSMTDAELEQVGALRTKADSKPGFPCRVSLEDAEIGDDVLLLNYVHLPENSPYKASHAIYVRLSASSAELGPNEVPLVLLRRILSVRGFGRDHLMKNADVVDGKDLAEKLNAFFLDPDIEYIHVHNAKQGCFAAKVTR